MTHPHSQDHSHDSAHGHSHGHSSHAHTHAADPETTYNWRIHHPFGENGDEVAVEVAPLHGLLPRWRFVVPAAYHDVTRWGIGPANGGPVSETVRRPARGGPVNLINGPEVVWFGGLEPLSSRKSAYLVFKGAPPHYVAFGQAEDPAGPPAALEGVTFGDHPAHPPLGEHSH